MRITLISFIILLLVTTALRSNAQNVVFPDANFKAALISDGVDTGDDGEISFVEAAAVTTMDVDASSITDLTGIAAFINLTNLSCGNNQISTLDLSANTALTYVLCRYNNLSSLNISANVLLSGLNCKGNHLLSLNITNNTDLALLDCANNELTTINTSNNPDLWMLYCAENDITSLDVSTNTSLAYLECHYNLLTNLDVSHNASLLELFCSNNALSSLDISANTSINALYLGNMPTLTSVCVWALPFPPVGMTLDTTGSHNIFFNAGCLTGFDETIEKSSVARVFPNPFNDRINWSVAEHFSRIVLTDLTGKIVFEKMLNGETSISATEIPNGVYFVILEHPNQKRVVLKVAK